MRFQSRPVEPSDRARVAHVVASVVVFTAEEQAVAIELLDHQLAHPAADDYRFIFAESEGPATLAGYLCYGRTPFTQLTYDLYWIATAPAFARQGVARGLVATMEAEIARTGRALVRVETGTREGHGSAVLFYDALGFERTARIPEFYAPDDDLLIFTKRVSSAG